MSRKIHVRPGKGQSKFGFIVGIIFCLIGLFIVVPTFGLFGLFWTAVAGYITYVNYRNGFTDKQIDSHVIEVDGEGEDVTVTTKAGFGRRSYEVEGKMHELEGSRRESAVDRLRELNSLYTQALITREEYNQKKKEILDEL
ncbi:MAG: SHOCT domain-containing protein [Lachnospiraceae bacterium]|nr:SHOCT domain-containing protein [Lachnospiraceae bacterium]